MDEKQQTNGMVSVPLVSVEGERYYAKLSNIILIACLVIVVSLLIGMIAFCYKTSTDCAEKIASVTKDCLDKVEAINDKWLDFMSQYDFQSYDYTYTQDGKGLNVMGENNEVRYNGADGESQETSSETEGWQSEGQGNTP